MSKLGLCTVRALANYVRMSTFYNISDEKLLLSRSKVSRLDDNSKNRHVLFDRVEVTLKLCFYIFRSTRMYWASMQE